MSTFNRLKIIFCVRSTLTFRIFLKGTDVVALYDFKAEEDEELAFSKVCAMHSLHCMYMVVLYYLL